MVSDLKQVEPEGFEKSGTLYDYLIILSNVEQKFNFIFEYYICYNKIVFVNCIVEKNISIEASIDIYTDVNCINQKHIGKLRIIYHSKSNSIVTLDTSYSILEKINLHISFKNGEKHKSTLIEFIVLGLDWSDYYPDSIRNTMILRKLCNFRYM